MSSIRKTALAVALATLSLAPAPAAAWQACAGELSDSCCCCLCGKTAADEDDDSTPVKSPEEEEDKESEEEDTEQRKEEHQEGQVEQKSISGAGSQARRESAGGEAGQGNKKEELEKQHENAEPTDVATVPAKGEGGKKPSQHLRKVGKVVAGTTALAGTGYLVNFLAECMYIMPEVCTAAGLDTAAITKLAGAGVAVLGGAAGLIAGNKKQARQMLDAEPDAEQASMQWRRMGLEGDVEWYTM